MAHFEKRFCSCVEKILRTACCMQCGMSSTTLWTKKYLPSSVTTTKPSLISVAEVRFENCFSWGVFGHVVCLDQLRASQNIWWIIKRVIPENMYADPSLSSKVIFHNSCEECVFAMQTSQQIVLPVLMLYKVSEPKSRTVSSDTRLKIWLIRMLYSSKKKINQFKLMLTPYGIKELIELL